MLSGVLSLSPERPPAFIAQEWRAGSEESHSSSLFDHSWTSPLPPLLKGEGDIWAEMCESKSKDEIEFRPSFSLCALNVLCG